MEPYAWNWGWAVGQDGQQARLACPQQCLVDQHVTTICCSTARGLDIGKTDGFCYQIGHDRGDPSFVHSCNMQWQYLPAAFSPCKFRLCEQGIRCDPAQSFRRPGFARVDHHLRIHIGPFCVFLCIWVSLRRGNAVSCRISDASQLPPTSWDFPMQCFITTFVCGCDCVLQHINLSHRIAKL